MSEDAQRYERVAADFTSRLSAVAPDQWSNATPCPEWAVRDLVAHVIDTHRRVLSVLDGSESAPVDVDGDLSAEWARASGELLAAVKDPATGTKVVKGFMGELPFETLVGGLACSDTVIHTWDLARATDQSERLDPGAVDHCHVLLESFGDGMRRPGGFSEAIASSADADAQTKFLHFAGRAV